MKWKRKSRVNGKNTVANVFRKIHFNSRADVRPTKQKDRRQLPWSIISQFQSENREGQDQPFTFSATCFASVHQLFALTILVALEYLFIWRLCSSLLSVNESSPRPLVGPFSSLWYIWPCVTHWWIVGWEYFLHRCEIYLNNLSVLIFYVYYFYYCTFLLQLLDSRTMTHDEINVNSQLKLQFKCQFR